MKVLGAVEVGFPDENLDDDLWRTAIIRTEREIARRPRQHRGTVDAERLIEARN